MQYLLALVLGVLVPLDAVQESSLTTADWLKMTTPMSVQDENPPPTSTLGSVSETKESSVPTTQPEDTTTKPAEETPSEKTTVQDAEQPAPSTEVTVTSSSKWDQLADCESGNWINGGQSFEEGSARWDWAKDGQVPPWGTTIHHGGLQFHPNTWTSFKPEGYPQYAYDASREQQIVVAEKVLAAQGWGAWPTCARKLGWR